MITLGLAATTIPLLQLGSVADVEVSDGKRYVVETCYAGPDEVRTEFRYPDHRVRIDITGAQVTRLTGSANESGSDTDRMFALGHQFLALVADFRSIVPNARHTSVEFFGDNRPAVAGPLAGHTTIALVQGTAPDRPAGLRIDTAGATPVQACFSEWSIVDG